MSDYIFIYGTLAPEHAPADVRDAVSRMKPIAAGMMTGQLYDLGDYPGAVFDETARSQVRGQVYELPTDDELIQKLDAYEEYDRDRPGSSLFVREKRPIKLTDGSKLPCWVYLYNQNPGKARLIAGGNYFTWSAQHSESSSDARFNR